MQCCCARFKCIPDGENRCGDPKETCIPDPDGPYSDQFCNGACPDPPPQCCDPPCGACEVCEPNCSKCPENPLGCCNPTCVYQCSDCESCDGDACKPLCPEAECLTCANGSCESICGECEFCANGTCVPCPDGTVCVDGVCVPPPPQQYYCCLDEVEPPPPPSEGEPTPPTPPPTASCHYGPCGKIVDGYFVPKPEWTVGGPYPKKEDCEYACRPFDCAPDNCGFETCQKTDGGRWLSLDKCRESGECNDISNGLCQLNGGPGATVYKYGVSGGPNRTCFDFTIDPYPDRIVCVSFNEPCGKPLRVQIQAPLLSAETCDVIADPVIVIDTEWMGLKDCSCNGSYDRSPRGNLLWRTKQKGVTRFQVCVMTECPDTEACIAVTCGDKAGIGPPVMCADGIEVCGDYPRCCDPCRIKIGDGPETINVYDLDPLEVLKITADDLQIPGGVNIETFDEVPVVFNAPPTWSTWADQRVDETLAGGKIRSLRTVGSPVHDGSSIPGYTPCLFGTWEVVEIPASPPQRPKPQCRIRGCVVSELATWNDVPPCGGPRVWTKGCVGIFYWYADIIDQELQDPVVTLHFGYEWDTKEDPVFGGCVLTDKESGCMPAPKVEINIVP